MTDNQVQHFYFSEEIAQEIVEALTNRGVTLPCPRCGNEKFNLNIEGIVFQILQPDPNNYRVLGKLRGIPSVVLTCSKCGYITMHALKTLGISPSKLTIDQNQMKEEKNG